jgi:hypothetical protein
MILKQEIVLFITYIICVSIFISCSNENSQAQQNNSNKSEHQSLALDLTPFSYIPPQIKGCTCFLSTNEQEFKKKQYIYVNDYVITSYVSINGVMTKFIMLNFNYKDSDNSVANYKSSQYEMKVEVKHLNDTGKKKRKKTGKITINSKDGKTLTKTFYGECNC